MSSKLMDSEMDNELAKMIQRGFPLVERPYLVLGERFGIEEDVVMEKIRNWKEENLLREVSAVMEGATLGYDSALVCGEVAPERLEKVASIINEHPTVTHNYQRNHNFNIWFTIAVPEEMGLERHLRILEKLTGVDRFYPLRRTTTFKVGVVFDMKSKRNDTELVKLPEVERASDNLSEEEKLIVRTLQKDLPVHAEPFLAQERLYGITPGALLKFAQENIGGKMRRYIGTFRHRKLGVRANGMTVWRIPEEKMEEKGMILASSAMVSHCYGRTSFPEFPYNLYSMLHGPDSDSLREAAEDLSKKIGCEDYLILQSPVEFKKVRLRYFLPELDKWEQVCGILADDPARVTA